jgi:hypothetical protein
MTVTEATRFELDRGAEAAVGRLRLVAAGVVGLTATGLAATGPGAPGWTFVVLAWLASLGWLGAWTRARRRLRRGTPGYLALDESGLHMDAGDGATFVPWEDVRRVEADEERLSVWLRRARGRDLRVEACWKNVSFERLAEAIADHHRAHLSGATRPVHDRPVHDGAHLSSATQSVRD